ncbi:MAG: hypothetical protein M1819_001419 [Sarea resinae]|nr:MAG: hypothetical protein M1819_001419 [Sarea resinae]
MSTNPPLLNTYQALVSTFTSFLTVAIHTILYERSIYPASSFLSSRKYNYPVRQNRHPKVCKWIQDAVAAVEAEMLKGTVARVAVVIYSPENEPLERFMFDVSRLPNVPPAEALTPFENTPLPAEEISSDPPSVSVVDLEEQFRGAMSKLSVCGGTLGALPENCSFTLCVELKDQANPPIAHPQPWIPAQPALQHSRNRDGDDSSGSTTTDQGRDLGGVKTTPIRAVGAGEFALEMWIEEGKRKRKQ